MKTYHSSRLKGELLALDSECRRLNPGSPWELLSVALVSDVRGPLLISYVQPRFDEPEKWENHLGLPTKVFKYAPSFEQICQNIYSNIQNKTLLVWNSAHESEVFCFLQRSHKNDNTGFKLQDLMKRCAPLLKPWNTHFGDYQWPSLQEAAVELGFSFDTGGHHTASADAQMLFKIWDALESNPLHLDHKRNDKEKLALVKSNLF